MHITQTSTARHNRHVLQDWCSPGLWLALLVAVPFAVGAAVLGWNLLNQPATAGQLAKTSLLQSHLFAFGFALGLVGAAVAVTTTSPQRRVLGTAATLFGCSHILLGFIGHRVIVSYLANADVSLLPFLVPTLLWFYSVWLAIRSPGVKGSPESEKQDAEQSPSSEEQPQLLSQP